MCNLHIKILTYLYLYWWRLFANHLQICILHWKVAAILSSLVPKIRLIVNIIVKSKQWFQPRNIYIHNFIYCNLYFTFFTVVFIWRKGWIISWYMIYTYLYRHIQIFRMVSNYSQFDEAVWIAALNIFLLIFTYKNHANGKTAIYILCYIPYIYLYVCRCWQYSYKFT